MNGRPSGWFLHPGNFQPGSQRRMAKRSLQVLRPRYARSALSRSRKVRQPGAKCAAGRLRRRRLRARRRAQRRRLISARGCAACGGRTITAAACLQLCSGLDGNAGRLASVTRREAAPHSNKGCGRRPGLPVAKRSSAGDRYCSGRRIGIRSHEKCLLSATTDAGKNFALPPKRGIDQFQPLKLQLATAPIAV